MSTIDTATLNALVEAFGTQVTSRELMQFDPTVYQKCADGALPKIKRGLYSLNGDVEQTTPVAQKGKVAPVAKPTLSEEEVSELIRERFDVLDLITEGVIDSNIRSVIISGAPGVGKSYTLEKKLEMAENTQRIKRASSLKGTCSAIGLYVTLWNNREKGKVVVLDDIDSIFNDEESMNLLKSALDTSEKRTLTYMKDSAYLKGEDIPQQFDYEGQIVFLTNVDVEAVIAKGGRNSVHMGALASRAVFLDLGIHTTQEIMVRIKQVMSETEMAKNLKLTPSAVQAILGWMESNTDSLRSVSLRTVIQIAGFMRTSPDRWTQMASVTLLNKKF